MAKIEVVATVVVLIDEEQPVKQGNRVTLFGKLSFEFIGKDVKDMLNVALGDKGMKVAKLEVRGVSKKF